MQEYCSNLTVNGKTFSFYDLEKAAKSHDVKVGELPYTIRILLESLLRKKDGEDVKESHISDLMKFPNFPTISKSTAPYAACRINAPSTGMANRSKDWNTGPSVKLISFFDIFSS